MLLKQLHLLAAQEPVGYWVGDRHAAVRVLYKQQEEGKISFTGSVTHRKMPPSPGRCRMSLLRSSWHQPLSGTQIPVRRTISLSPCGSFLVQHRLSPECIIWPTSLLFLPEALYQMGLGPSACRVLGPALPTPWKGKAGEKAASPLHPCEKWLAAWH